MFRLTLAFMCLLIGLSTTAQKTTFYGELQQIDHKDLQDQFKDYQVYQIDATAISEMVQSNINDIHFDLILGNNLQWDLQLVPNDLRGEDYQITTPEGGTKDHSKDPVKTFHAYLATNVSSRSALTIDKDFLYGFIKQQDAEYFIEPLSYFIKGMEKNLFVVYNSKDVLEKEGQTCGVQEMKKNVDRQLKYVENIDLDPAKSLLACYEIELAIASDWLMFVDYGSVVGVENHNIGVMNNVGTNYDNEFFHSFEFVIVTQFVSNCSSCDPWTASTDPGLLLDDFRSWGNGGNFGVTFDIGQCWTDRNFNGGTVGLAWVGAVCNSFRYHVLQDFTTNANFLRVMTAHEIGHNCNYGHDAGGSPFIMAPVVSASTIWSGPSVTAIDAYLQTRINNGCLGTCGSSNPLPPIPSFSADIQDGCAPLTVQFTDNSTGGPVNNWLWDFPGGSPNSSTLQNPTVTYTTAGTYDVTLEVSNLGGTNTLFEPDYITVDEVPVSDFIFFSVELETTFTNLSTNANTYYWDFGDGNNSTDTDPIHTYDTDGLYFVTLEATNDCGTVVFTEVVEVYSLPFAFFSADIVQGCVPMTVNFEDLSSFNSLAWNWSFPGGTPSSSTAQNPTVVYDTPGFYDVSLTVSNPAGTDTYSESSYIEVMEEPLADFTYVVTMDSIVDFTNISTGGGIYLWDFGDGNTSTEINPTHIYAVSGDYEVSLTAENFCDVAVMTSTVSIDIMTVPVAGFTASPTSGCEPLTVTYSDQSFGADSWAWTFPGGTPATSTMQNPVVVYNAGTFDATLTVTNSFGSNTVTEIDFIVVDPLPEAIFTSNITLDVINVTNNSVDADSYAWDFGDGNTSTDLDPSNTYAMDGSYTVQLISTNACGNDTTTQDIVILTPPSAGFNAPVTSGCADLTVDFTDQSSSNSTSWEWSFPSATPNTSTQQNPSVVYNTSGAYDVILIVMNGAGTDTLTQTAYVNVDDVPNSGFTTTATDMTVVFNNTTTNGTSYAWDFGDGNMSTATDPTNVYAADGTYIVELIATNGCGNDTTTQTVIISNLPMAGFNAPVTSGCADLTVNYINQSSSNTTAWEWAFPGGSPSTSSDPNPMVVYTTSGSYNVTLIVTSSAGNDTLTQTAYVNVIDVPDSGFNSSSAGTTANFTNTSTNATTYSWDFGDGNNSTSTDPSHDYGMDGTYTVQLIATNTCGNDTTTQTVVISNLPSAGFSSNITSGCTDLVINFTDQSSLNATTWSWSFPGGTPSISTQQNPTVTYSTAGTYDVTLTVSNAAGDDTETQTAYVVVDDVPDSGFTSTVAGTTADFTNTTTNGTTYSWDFGDGNNSSSSNPSHDYGMDGTYTVELIATNGCGSDTTTQTVVVSNLPSAGFSSNITSGCTDLVINFTDQSSLNATSWSWSFPGGTPSNSTQQNPTVTYSTAGTYDVTLTVSNAAGDDTETQTAYVIVDDVPDSGFTTTVAGTTADFTNTTTNGTTYNWDFGDGNTSSSTNPSNNYGMDGTYTVELIATNGCGSDTTTQTIVISNLPSAGFNSDVNSGCADLVINFTDQSSLNATSWSWSFPGGTPSSSTEQNPTVTYTTAGTYDVSLTVSNAAGDDTETQTSYVVVDDIPSAGFTSNVAGNTVSFTNMTTNGTSYAWDFGDGNTSNLTDPTNGYLLDGTYTVELVATNACGTSTTTETIVISTLPSAGFTADVTSGCADLVVNFMDQSSINAASWSWTFPGGSPATSTDENPTVTYSTAGSYDVTLTVSNAAGNDTEMITSYVAVSDVPAAGFTSSIAGTTVTFTNTSTNATTYSWDFGDGNTNANTNPTHTYAADGTYTVVLTASNACGTVTTTETVVVETEPVAGFIADVTVGCGPLTVNFTDLSSSNTTAWDWTFGGATPGNSTEQNPIITFEDPGSYTVSLIATAPAGNSTYTQIAYITVLDSPSASFNSNVVGTVATFSNTTTGGDTYFWNFGDGNTSTDPNPMNDYLTDGVYTVTMTATNICGSVTVTETVTIVTPPSAGFSADVVEGCAPLTVNFIDQSSTNATSWSWVFTGGTPATSTDQNPIVVFNNPGTFGVSLEVDNSAGSDMASQAAYIIVNTTPTAGYTSVVNGATATFTNISVNADTYSWDFGDGTNSILSDPDHSYTAAGTYTVILTATNACGSVSFTETVTIVSPPAVAFSADVTSGCAPLVVNFTDLSSGVVISWDWTFNGGTPAISSMQNPTVQYNTPGLYAVTLTAATIGGSGTFTQTAYITVLDVPTAGFTSSNVGADYTFNNISTNATTYSWDFGDGNMSGMENPSHTYMNDGTYTVTLVASNDCGSVTSTEQVTVLTAPIAGFTSDVTSGCAPLVVSFEDLSSSNTESWDWNFEGGSPATSSDQNPVVTYDTPGIYEVTLTVGNAAGNNTVTQTSYVTVTESAPLSGFSTTTTGSTIDFVSTSSGGTIYNWDFGDGNVSMEENPSHTYASDGTYVVTLIVSNGCGESTVTETVVIATPPTADFVADVTNGCAPLEVSFTNQSSDNAVSWNWTFDGAFPSNSIEENPTVVYSTAGTYDVILVATNAQGEDVETQVSLIVVNEGPTASFNFLVTDFNVDFTNTSSGGTSYSWDFGDANNSMEENPSHTYSGPGTYDVILTVTNACGSETFTETVEIEGGVAPVAGFTSDVVTGCIPLTVNFMDASTGADTWAWTFMGGTPETSTQENPVVVYDTPGTYEVSLAVTNAFGSNSVTQVNYVVVQDVPTAAFTFDQTDAVVTFTSTSTMAGTHSWDFGDGELSGLENPVHVYEQTGTYTVTLTVTNQCGSNTFTETIDVMVDGVNDPASVTALNLYPNPNGGYFTLELEGNPIDEVEVRFYNVIGQVVFANTYDFSSGNLVQSFDFNDLPAAAYIMQLRMGTDVVYRKVIVE